jgi:hypothetical protein
MDWSILWYFLAAVLAAGMSYAMWPKDRRPMLNISDEPLSLRRARRRRRAA